METPNLLSETVYSTVAHALCAAAVAWGSEYTLKRWIAVSSLVPPPKPSSPPSPAVVFKGWRRIFNKKNAKFVVFLVTFFSVEFFLIFGLNKIASQTVIDVFWSAVETLLFTTVTYGASLIFWPTKTFVKYVRKDVKEKSVVGLTSALGRLDRPRLAFSLAVALSTLGTSVMGYRFMQPIIAAAWVLQFATSYNFANIKVKWLMLLVNGYLVFAPIIVFGLVAGIAWLFDAFSSSSESSGEKSTVTNPSDWVLRMMMIFGTSMPSVISLVYLGLAVRFDHSRSTGSLRLPTAAPGEAVEIPSKVDSFPKPMFTAGLVTHITILGVLEFLSFKYEPKHLSDIGWIFVVSPVVSIALLLRAWSLGQLQAWWHYQERWVPKDESAPTQKDVEEGVVDEEKRRLLEAEEAQTVEDTTLTK